MVRFALKLTLFAVLVGVPTWWLYELWQATATMPMEEVCLPWLPWNVDLSLPEGILTGAAVGLLLGFILVFVLFGGSRRTSRLRLRRQVEQLRSQLSEAEAEVDVLKGLRQGRDQSEKASAAPLRFAPTSSEVGEEKPEPNR